MRRARLRRRPLLALPAPVDLGLLPGGAVQLEITSLTSCLPNSVGWPFHAIDLSFAPSSVIAGSPRAYGLDAGLLAGSLGQISTFNASTPETIPLVGGSVTLQMSADGGTVWDPTQGALQPMLWVSGSFDLLFAESDGGSIEAQGAFQSSCANAI